MCTILFAINEHPQFKFILAANRDEFLNREALPMHWWSENRNSLDVLAGKDLKGGGTWLGMNRNGRFATVTNVRDLTKIKTDAPSRGELIHKYLLQRESDLHYLETIQSKQDKYSGFNLLLGSPDKLHFISNCSESVYNIDSGIHGLSNASLNTPWPKVVIGKEKLESIIRSDSITNSESQGDFEIKLFDVLEDDSQAPFNELPDTGVGVEKELMLSSMLIKSPQYGTRVSTIILVDYENNMKIVEKNQINGNQIVFTKKTSDK